MSLCKWPSCDCQDMEKFCETTKQAVATVRENTFEMNVVRQLQIITFKPVNTPPEWARFVLQFNGGEYYYSDCEPEPMAKPRLANVYGAVCKPMPATLWPGRVTDWELVMPIPERSQPDIYRMITEQNADRRNGQFKSEAEQKANEAWLEANFYERPPEDVSSKPATSFDWELLQAMNHLTTAISCTDDVRAMQLTAALNIVKGVSADD